MVAHNGGQTRSSQRVTHHRRMGTLFRGEGYEDHLPYDREDRLRPPFL